MTEKPPILTVFTPTYNRAYILPQLYQSLIKQTNPDFIWLIIDDGSSDDTKTLVKKWIKERKLHINYIYQENQGMHGAHNTAYKNIDTELNVCIDSDDYMPVDAVATILEFWQQNKSNKVAGIVGLDIDKTGKVIGTKMPANIKTATLSDLYHKYGVKGDKKLVLRTKVVKKYPAYPLFEGERFVPLGHLYSLIDQDYELLILNKALCVVEYMADGSTMNIFKQYRKNPKGFAFTRLHKMKNPYNTKDLIKNTIHYISHSLFSKNWQFIKQSPRKFLTIVLIPFGIILYFYTIYKTRK